MLVGGGGLMRRIKVPLQDFVLKMQWGAYAYAWGDAFCGDTMVEKSSKKKVFWMKTSTCRDGTLNSLYTKGTFMCPRNASALRGRHIYVPADVIQPYELNSETKGAFGVNLCLLSRSKCRPHLSTYITPQERQEGVVLVHDRSWIARKTSNAKLFLEHKELAAYRFHIRQE